MFSWKSSPRPIVALAPMADMTDTPFCLVCKDEGVPLIFREMISAEAVVRANPKTLKMADFDQRERPIVQQIFGANPDTMAQAATIIYERFKPDAIDINMGCPVYNIVSNFNGAALMKDPHLASRIVKQMKIAVPCPVSVKTRLGWSKDDECLELVKVLADAGVDLISMHGRTKAQAYSGKADWKRVGDARRNVPHLPFLVNGDITTPELAKEAIDISGADGVLIGRGMLGRPWFAKEVLEYLSVSIRTSANRPIADAYRCVRSADMIKQTICKHARLQVECYGERGLLKLRKHLPWYVKHVPELKHLKEKLVRISTLIELEDILRDTS